MLAPGSPTAIHRVAKVARFAARDQPRHFAVMRRHALAVLGNVAGNKPPQCIGDGDVRRLRSGTHLLAGFLRTRERCVDDRPRICFRDLGQMQVDHRRLKTFVTKECLNRLQADVNFE